MRLILTFTYFLVFFTTILAQKQPVEYVNPHIGTDGHGHTFPGATVPFGMVQLSPDTRTDGWDAAGGYHYSDGSILGFSHTHLNGTGVNDLCDIRITPSVKSRFDHENEVAKAGYYKVKLEESGILAELTASTRVGFHRYRFPDTTKTVVFTVTLNARNLILKSRFRAASETAAEGYVVQKAWAAERHLAFRLEANAPFELSNKKKIYKSNFGKPVTVKDENEFQIQFDVSKTHEILLKVALSPTSEENAVLNLEKEIPHWDFDKTRKEAEAEWSKYLNRIQIKGGTEDQRAIFYTALYHTLIHPSVSQDVNGDYRGLDNKIYNSHKFTYHSIFSLWDTYRAAHPLYTIVCPEKVPDFINGFLDDFDRKGHLPVWNFSGNETWCMIGNHAVPVIADAYLKGIKGFDAKRALNAMVKSVNRDTFGLKAYREKGYIPADTEGESVSKTLEYAFDDYAIAMMAQAMGEEPIYQEYIRRSQNWKNLFNPKTGFFQAKINETFVEPFEPREVNIHFTEGNAWQYAFAVQHDVAGLIHLLDGGEKFEAKLDAIFSAKTATTGRDQVDITGLIGQYAHGNEPSHHLAYLYNGSNHSFYSPTPSKTARLVRQIMADFYKNAPDGLIGNEDCGQMSAWYVFSAMGFYPANPVGNHYQLGSGIFDESRICPNEKDCFSIKLENNSAQNLYSAFLKNSYWAGFDFNWGETLTLKMQSKPLEYEAYDFTKGHNFPFTLPIPFVAKGTKLFKEKQTIELADANNVAQIFYTTDGSDPRLHGKKYSEPIEIDQTKTIKFEARIEEEHSKTAVATFKKINKTTTIKLKNPPAPQYSGGAEDVLVDGERGVANWQLGGWQGFEGVDLEAVIDLGAVKNFRKIALHCVEDQNAWIFPPSKITIFTSDDGINFKEFSEQTPDLLPNTEGLNYRILGKTRKGKARFVKLVAQPLKPIPAWHKGAGGKGWIFATEIVVE